MVAVVAAPGVPVPTLAKRGLCAKALYVIQPNLTCPTAVSGTGHGLEGVSASGTKLTRHLARSDLFHRRKYHGT